MSQKAVITVEGRDKQGENNPINIKISLTNDWKGNLTKLNTKIRKKFQTQDEYALSFNGMTIRYDDISGFANIMKQVDSNDKPHFKIVDINCCSPDCISMTDDDIKIDERQIIVHYKHYKEFVFNVSDELNEDIYQELLDSISQHFKININNKTQYQIADDEQCAIDDFEEFEEYIIDGEQNEDTIHLYIKDTKKPTYPDGDEKEPIDYIGDSGDEYMQDKVDRYPVIPLVMPNNCTYNPQTHTMKVHHNKPRRTLVPYEPALDYIRGIEERISTISIVGKARTGKSMVAGELYAPKQIPCPFDLGNLMDACTYGIWVSAKPIPHPTKEDTVMLIIDVEGTGFHGNTKNHDTQLMVVALLISSYFIYNSKGSFDASCLEEIKFITELADRIKTTPDDQSDGEDLQYILPIFMWLLRDVHLTPTINGKKVQVRRYFQEKVLKYERGKGSETRRRQEIRDVFQDIFQKYDAFMLPMPHNEQHILEQMGTIPRHRLAKSFNNALHQFCNLVKREAGVKMLFSKNIEDKNEFTCCTGPLLAGLIEEIVHAVNDPDKVPVISSMTENIMINHYRKATTKAIDEYKQDFNMRLKILKDNKDETPLNEIDITELHYQCFNKILNGPASCLRVQSDDIEEKANVNKVDIHQQQAYEALCNEIGHNDENLSLIGKKGFLFEIFTKNTEFARNFATKYIDTYFEERIEEMLHDPQNYEAQNILDAINEMETSFFSECKGEIKTICWNNFKNVKLKQNMKFFENAKGFSEELLKVQKEAAEHREKHRAEAIEQQKLIQQQQQRLEQHQTETVQMKNKFNLEIAEHQKQLTLTQERMQSLQQTNTANERKNKQLIDSYKSQVQQMQTNINNINKTHTDSLKRMETTMNKNINNLQATLKQQAEKLKQQKETIEKQKTVYPGYGMYPYGMYPYSTKFTFNYTDTNNCQITEGGTRMRSLGKGCPYVCVSTSYGWSSGIHTWAIRTQGTYTAYSAVAVVTNYSAATGRNYSLSSLGCVAQHGNLTQNEITTVTLDLINWKVIFHKNSALIKTVNITNKGKTYYPALQMCGCNGHDYKLLW